jgi:hypothetical protein
MVDRVRYEMLVPIFQQEWQRRAAQERLAALAQSCGRQGSALVRLGSILIAAGCRLQAAGDRRSPWTLSPAPAPCAGVARS